MLSLKLEVKDTDKGLKIALARVAELAKGAYVKVGVVGDGKVRKEERAFAKMSNRIGPKTKKESAATAPPDNLQIAIWNEFGTTDGRVPERSFIRSTFDAKHDEWIGGRDKFVGWILDGLMTPQRALGLLGLRMESDIKNRILAGIDPANAPATIAAKGSSHPLIDTGQLLAAIVSQVVTGEGEGEHE